MTAYGGLAQYYDEFNSDVPYESILKFYRALFERVKISPSLILDLACGTGNMSVLLAKEGFEVIGVDISSEMLAEAYTKDVPEGKIRPIYLCQPMEELDLYGTVDAALCCLDGIGYMTEPDKLAEALRRVCLFLDPGGAFIFDINSAFRLRGLDGHAYTRENEGAFCVYQADYEPEDKTLTYTLELFERSGKLYRRTTEYHSERAYETSELYELLINAGFAKVEFFGDRRLEPPREDEERIFVMAVKPE